MVNFEYNAFEIGDKLQAKRKENGYSQDRASELLGISVDSISRYENGQSKITAEVLAKISILYRTPIDFFIGKSNNENNIDPEIMILLEQFNCHQQNAVRKMLEIINETFVNV